MKRRPTIVVATVISLVLFSFVSVPILLMAHGSDGEDGPITEHELSEIEQMRRKIEREDQHRAKAHPKAVSTEQAAQSVSPPAADAKTDTNSSASISSTTGSETAPPSSPVFSPTLLVYLVGSTLVVIGAVYVWMRRVHHSAKGRS